MSAITSRELTPSSPKLRFLTKRRSRRLWLLLIVSLVVPLLTVTVGAAAVPVGDVVGIIASHLGFDVTGDWSQARQAIVWQTRVPRTLIGLSVGAILGVCGCVLQALVRNPLAEPYLLGVSSGASSGAALAILVLGVTSSLATGFLAFLGALVATLVVLLIAGRTQNALQLILAGLAVGFGFQALTNLMIFGSDSPEASRAVMFWTLGSLSRGLWSQVPLVLIIAVLITVAMSFFGPVLDAMASGDKTALSVGIDPARTRLALLLPVSAAVAVAVAVSGGIGFVGLIVPHLMRSFIGYSHRWLVVGSALFSAIFLVCADAVARVVFAPQELPIGIITGLIGAPFLVWLIRTQGRQRL